MRADIANSLYGDINLKYTIEQAKAQSEAIKENFAFFNEIERSRKEIIEK